MCLTAALVMRTRIAMLRVRDLRQILYVRILRV